MTGADGRSTKQSMDTKTKPIAKKSEAVREGKIYFMVHSPRQRQMNFGPQQELLIKYCTVLVCAHVHDRI